MNIVQLNTSKATLLNGRLADISLWSPEIGKDIADSEGLKLTDEHWFIIKLMRDYYSRFKISPVARLLKKNIKRQLGEEFANDEYLNSLFPDNVLIQGTRIAGLPVPQDADVVTTKHQSVAAPKTDSKNINQQEELYFTHDFTFDGHNIRVHPTGNLKDPNQWSEPLAFVLAQKEEITLIDEHWEIIRHLRGFYFRYGITPMVRLLINNLKQASNNKTVNVDHLYTLFPDGPARQGSRIAGLPLPQGCID